MLGTSLIIAGSMNSAVVVAAGVVGWSLLPMVDVEGSFVVTQLIEKSVDVLGSLPTLFCDETMVFGGSVGAGWAAIVIGDTFVATGCSLMTVR